MERSMRANVLTGLALLIIVATVAIGVATRDWGMLIILAGVVAFYAMAFRSRLNSDQVQVVSSEHAVSGRLEAVEFFWRPG